MYILRNKKDKRIVFGFDKRYNPPHMRYISNPDERVPRLFSEIDIHQVYLIKQVPKCCEFVKVRLEEVIA